MHTTSTTANPDGGLLERERELARLRELIGAAAAGDGRLVLVEGDPGIGKSALLRAAHEIAAGAGSTVLTARGAELERDFAHGVARQLYEPLLHGASEARVAAMLRGAAALAAPILGLPAADRPAGDPAFAANHGLYWLTSNLAEESPLVLLVDDAHWSDAATLRFLDYLARRLGGLPVLVALALRPGAESTLLDALASVPEAESLNPAALSEQASGTLIERLAGRAPEAGFRDACHDVTAGNPFLLEQLLRAFLAEGIDPDERSAERVRRLVPRSISRSVIGRLAAMGPAALALARAVSVLDTDAALRHAAALAGLDARAAERAADELTAAAVLAPGRPLRYAHPIMRRAVYEDIPRGHRAGQHGDAARLLDAEGGDPDRAAVHLLATEPAASGWVLGRLRTAAARAVGRGAPGAAAVLLRRALAEPPEPGQRAATLLELGRAERLAGEPAAVDRLREARDSAREPAVHTSAARELATALATETRLDEAVEVLGDAIADAPDRETRLVLEAHLFGLSQASDTLAARVAPRLERLCEGMRGDTPGERLALAANVFHRTFVGLGSGAEVAEVARRALGDGRLLREATGDHFAFYGPLIALRDSDHHDELRPLFEEAIADARARGSAAAAALTLATLARLEHLQGELARAEATGRSALEAGASSSQYRLMLPLALSALLVALVERGELDAADGVLAAHGLADGPPPATSPANPLLAARARLRLAQGRIAEAVADTVTWLERQRLRGGLNAVGASSIMNPALAFLAAGDREAALAIAAEMLAVAERWAVAGHTGSCLIVLGLVTGGDRGIEHLRAAAGLLDTSPRRLELARAQVELGAALRRANRRTEARPPLLAGMELAHRCGAAPLADRAHRELRATGARPRRLVLSGVDALTAQEQRVAEMAADGLSNPEIAQALFVTRRTIETHLGHVYAKLGIESRHDLAAALR